VPTVHDVLAMVGTLRFCPPHDAAPQLRQINPSGKISLNTSGKSLLQIRRLTRQEGRIAIVTNAGGDVVDATASCAEKDCRAG
jgi:hypothetical protein